MTARIVGSALAGLLLLSAAASASAQDTRAVVLDFTGRYGDQIRTDAVRSLQGNVELVPQAEFEGAVGSLDSEDDYAEAASATGVSAIISADVGRRGRNYEITITLRGGDGAVVREVAVAHRNPRRLAGLVRGGLWNQMGDDILSAPQPAAAASAADEDEADELVGGDGDGRVLVVAFSGSGASQAQARVVTSLEDAGYEVQEVRAETPAERVEAALEFGAQALVGGEVYREGSTWFAEIRVYNGYDGEELDDFELEEPDASSMLSALEDAAGQLGGAIDSGEVPDEDAVDEASDSDSGPSGPRPSPLQVFAGMRIFNRDFSYTDDLATILPDAGLPGLRSYSLPAGPALELDMVVYPLAFFMDGFAADIGLEGGLVYAFGIESQECQSRDAQGDCMEAIQFPTSSVQWNVGARVRFRVDTHEIYARAGYHSQSFRIEALFDRPAPEVPDVDYGIVRLGAGTRLQFSPVVIEPRASFLIVTSTGQLGSEDWFPRSSALGFEAGLRAGFQLLDWLELTAGFDYTQIGISMNNEPGDDPNRVAGGATDRWISGSVGAQVRIPGDE